MKHKALLATIPLLFALACATLTVDKTRTGALKRVAIVGFSVEQPISKGLESVLSSGHRQQNTDWGSGLGSTDPLADKIYQTLEKQLHTDIKWTVIDRSVIAKNGHYMALYDQKMKGLQSRPPSPAGTKMLAAEGIVDAWPLEVLEKDKRDELMKKLGVDAIAVATVIIHLEKGGGLKQLVGAGDYFPKATVRFALFDNKSNDPVWRDLAAVGHPVDQGVEHVFGVTNKTSLDKKMALAAQYSIQRLLARFLEGNG